MFSGIIEALGTVQKIETEGSNIHLTVACNFVHELYIDQSIAHNGVCLTVVKMNERSYVVTAIKETLDLTNLSNLVEGSPVNLERCITADKLLDGHMVQGHVDCIGECKSVVEEEGSWYYEFNYPKSFQHLIVSKGSIAVNGVSLTVVEPTDSTFKVAIIPYTHEHTNFHTIKFGSQINLEFDIIGKYVAKQMKAYTS